MLILLGGFAQKKATLIDNPAHTIVRAAHPSPLSAKGFFGKHVSSLTNAALKEKGRGEIDWQLPDLKCGARGSVTSVTSDYRVISDPVVDH